jgi:hypothetical protein
MSKCIAALKALSQSLPQHIIGPCHTACLAVLTLYPSMDFTGALSLHSIIGSQGHHEICKAETSLKQDLKSELNISAGVFALLTIEDADAFYAVGLPLSHSI